MFILKVSYRYMVFVLMFLWPTYIQHGPHFLLPMGPWAPSFQKLGRTLTSHYNSFYKLNHLILILEYIMWPCSVTPKPILCLVLLQLTACKWCNNWDKHHMFKVSSNHTLECYQKTSLNDSEF